MRTQMIDRIKYPKILIVGTLPYNPNESSRALDTYFHNWPKENLRMIFSNGNRPIKGHCSSFYQITDVDVAKNFFKGKKHVGRVFNDEDLLEQGISPSKKVNNKIFNVFRRKTVLRFYLRKMIWSHKRWLSHDLIRWVEDFSPDILYICFSDDYFVLDIAYFFSQRYKIPTIAQIGDDYYFKKSNPFLSLYNNGYKKLFNRIMETDGFGLYISDKLTTKYNSAFKKKGFPVYLSSDIVSNNDKPKFEFNYFGKIDLGRYKSLAILGDSLFKINNNYKVCVYSTYKNKKIKKYLEKHNCICQNPIEYKFVKEIMNSGSFNIIASGFDVSDIEATRYSLSTKVADSLVSSGPILAIGPVGDGAIDYLLKNNCAIVLKDKNVNIDQLKIIINDDKYLENISNRAKEVYNFYHDIKKNRNKFENECRNLVRKNEI